MENYVQEVYGVPVVMKTTGEENSDGQIDERLLAEVKENSRRGRQETKPLSIEATRRMMGGVNYNLNTVEIYTRYIEVPTTCGKVPVWMYYPRKMKAGRPGLLYVHGGAFFGGSIFAVENQCRLIAERADSVVCNIDYSLAPEHPYPIPPTQIYETLHWIGEHARPYGIDREQLFIGGDSAGGNLAAVVAQMDRDRGSGLLKGEILIYAKLTFTNTRLPGYQRDLSVFELQEDHKQYLAAVTEIGSEESNAGDEHVYVQGNYDVTIPYISPAFGKKSGLPKTLMIQAEYDGLRLEGEFYAGQLHAENVPVKMICYRGVTHGFFDKLGILPQTEDAVNEMVDFILGR